MPSRVLLHIACSRRFLALGLLVAYVACAAGAEGGAPGTTAAPALTAPAAATVPPPLRVIGVVPADESPGTAPGATPPGAHNRALPGLGDSIWVLTSPELADYVDFNRKQNKALSLFLDGNDASVAPEAIDRSQNRLRFRLERNAANKKLWSALLRYPFLHQTRAVQVSVGPADGTPVFAESAAVLTLSVVRWAWYAWVWLGVLAFALVVFGVLVARYDLLRDGKKPQPFSLGRSQMAWWFFLVIVSYVMIWLISGDQDTITPSLLALIGISAATALGAVLIDSRAVDGGLSQAAADRLALEAARQNAQNTLDAARANVQAAPADAVAQKNLADAQAALAVVNARLITVNNTINAVVAVPVTRGFFRDILTDSNGTAGLHRFQILVWTIVLGIIFLVSVFTQLSMPEFSPALLATMGISAGTYLGFKFPEK